MMDVPTSMMVAFLTALPVIAIAFGIVIKYTDKKDWEESE